MNGAESLVRTLVKGGVDICFTNPGTSEMHFCAALDRVDGMRCILGLFEGVVTGAADGYGRMMDSPAATLLHTGPGLANGVANLHNAKKAMSPIVNIVGEHATYHIAHDAPLTADIEGIAWPVSDWVKTSDTAQSVARDGAQAIAEAKTAPGRIATLILPADTAWNEADGVAEVPDIPPPDSASEGAVRDCADALRSGEPCMLLLGSRALRADALEIAGRIAVKTGADIRTEFGSARSERGAGIVTPDRIPYVVDQALALTNDFRHMILIGAKKPVAFFAYPGKPSVLIPDTCQTHLLGAADSDVLGALEWLADELDANDVSPVREELVRPALGSGELTIDKIASAIGHLMPEGCIVDDESITSGRLLHPYTKGCPPHDWLFGTGGSIGRALPDATGAAVACPDRKVLCLSGDGSAMYTIQALWTQARENLDVVTVIYANQTYAILHGELRNVGANPGPKAHDMFDLDRPNLNWVQMANGMGVDALRVDTAEGFNRALAAAFNSKGPFLIEAIV
ncbi:MAG: acetolactate synthase large subunit [Rhodospirillaceae bacterium]|jgi:acetolactate synthase I/II/III large subunit|nr:acetolactate synthase large subunit [Rhodospirillaceae bacterium]MBT6512998.1 acetolactate synthase large subunit [Rhodospirillaceae bacterium]MBT7611969.1 acetolactate synthase large subunit [Rhodospirillaceae bacterium]MBT7647975.1 acetolactate synthase large subunit [Rhodospirillaceae bacterium]